MLVCLSGYLFFSFQWTPNFFLSLPLNYIMISRFKCIYRPTTPKCVESDWIPETKFVNTTDYSISQWLTKKKNYFETLNVWFLNKLFETLNLVESFFHIHHEEVFLHQKKKKGQIDFINSMYEWRLKKMWGNYS